MLFFTLLIPDPLTSSNETLWAIIGILIGILGTGVFSIVAVNKQNKAAKDRIPLQVKSELDSQMKLLEEKIKEERKDKWWNLKFESFIELQNTMSDMAKYDENKGFIFSRGTMLHIVNRISYKQHALFENNLLNKEMVDLLTYIKELKVKNDKISDEDWGQIGLIFQNALDVIKSDLSKS